jgi:hypothetical protein
MRLSIGTAATRPVHLLVLASALIAGLVIALWLLPVGLIAYGTLVVLSLRDVTAAPSPAPRPLTPLAGTAFQAQLDAITRAQTQIHASVSATEGPLRPALERVTTQVGDIVEEAYTIATKGQTIVTYLQGISLGELNGQLARVENQISRATDPQLRRQYEETRAAVADRLRNAQALGTYRERISAQLETICANLDNVLAETVRLRAAAPSDGGVTTDSVAGRLSDVRADLDALAQVLDTALTDVNSP